MKRKNLSVAGFLFIVVVAAACSTNDNIPFGTWKRNIEDADLFVTGSETLTINTDSTFSIDNAMLFSIERPAMTCMLRYVTHIKGRWRHVNGELFLNFNPNTYSFDTIPHSFVLFDTSGRMCADSIRQQLSDKLNAFYSDSYDELALEGSTVLKEIHTPTDDTFRALNNDVLLEWTKKQ